MDLVVARFNEPLAWLADVDGVWDIHVWNMGDTPVLTPGRKVHVNQIRDCGRESYAYINHILFNWEKLDEFTVFCQGNPFDHFQDGGNFIESLKSLRKQIVDGFKMGEDVPDYIPMGDVKCCVPDEDLPRLAYRYPLSPKMDYFKSESGRVLTPLRQIWRQIAGKEDLPVTMKFTWGNQFMARKGAIKRRGREFWVKAIELINHDTGDQPSPFETCAYERLFPVMLGVK